MKMWPGWEGSSQGFNFKALEKKRGRGRIRDGDALGVGGDREEIFRDRILGAGGSEVPPVALFQPRDAFKGGGREVSSGLHGKSFYSCKQKGSRALASCPAARRFLPRSCFGGKTLGICSARPGSTSERAASSPGNGGEHRSAPTSRCPPLPKMGPTGQLGACLLIIAGMLTREERRMLPGARRRWGRTQTLRPVERGRGGGSCGGLMRA